MLVLFPLLKYLFQPSITFEMGIVRYALFMLVVSKLLLSFAIEDWMVLCLPILDGFSVLGTPTARAILSRNISSEAQASLFSGLQVVQQMGFLFAILSLPNVWAVTVGSQYTNAFIYIELAVYGIGFLLLLIIHPPDLESNEALAGA